MSRFKYFSVLALVVACFSVIFLWQRLHIESQANDQLRDHVVELELELARRGAVAVGASEVPRRMTERDVAGVRGSVGNEMTRDAVISAANNLGQRGETGFRELLKDPEYRKVQKARLFAEISRLNTDLARELRLSPEQAEALFELLAEQQLDASIRSLSVETGEVGDLTLQQEEMRDLALQQQSAITGILGPAGYQQYREYQKTLPVRRQLVSWQSVLAAANVPLTGDQMTMLVARLAIDEPQIVSSVRSLDPSDPQTPQEVAQRRLDSATERNRRMQEAAQPYLDSAQAEALRTALDLELNLARAARRAVAPQQTTR